jgi:hypothetical protein
MGELLEHEADCGLLGVDYRGYRGGCRHCPRVIRWWKLSMCVEAKVTIG